VRRVTLTQGLEVAGVLVSTKEGISGPSTSSPFLPQLQFDCGSSLSAGTRGWSGRALNWTRKPTSGAWNLGNPILLGHIHVLSGDLLFHGNRYRVARGDINFANPFRLDPVVNVEASTTIQQYENNAELQWSGEQADAGVSFGPAAAGKRHRYAAGAGANRTGGHATKRLGIAEAERREASALLSEAVIQSGRRAAGKIIWDHQLSSRSLV